MHHAFIWEQHDSLSLVKVGPTVKIWLQCMHITQLSFLFCILGDWVRIGTILTKHNVKKGPEQDKCNVSRRHTSSSGGVGASFNNGQSLLLMLSLLQAVDYFLVGWEGRPCQLLLIEKSSWKVQSSKAQLTPKCVIKAWWCPFFSLIHITEGTEIPVTMLLLFVDLKSPSCEAIWHLNLSLCCTDRE